MEKFVVFLAPGGHCLLYTSAKELLEQKLSRNVFTNQMAPFIIGIKDHMGHFIMKDEDIDKIFDITQKANLIYMSHTQDPEHSWRMYPDWPSGRCSS